ncbi:MAG: methyltransferase domain-containing protein [Lachnospiraceae bacterium]|nr:methyltransferase domain-containing protein [Lachnospiraceae bacterium]
MKFLKVKKYDETFIKENLMGPNSLKIAEELTSNLELHPGMKVLDLGCGKGLTSIFLAKEFGVTVYAADLWISPEENIRRFQEMGLEHLITPVHAEAGHLPFPKESFDAVISIDAYHYFGREPSFLDEKLAPFIKQNGLIALAFPGLKNGVHDNLPPELLLSWTTEDLDTMQSPQWWNHLLSHSEKIRVRSIREMDCFAPCWDDWLSCDNEFAANDRKSMDAGAGAYMNLISIIANKL